MFDTFYPLNGLGNSSSLTKSHLRLQVRKYRFDTPLHPYILEIECFINNFYVIQYYRRLLKNNPRKYQLQTNEHRAMPIIGTCLQAIKLISDKDPKSSFGFIGSNSFNEVTGEEEAKPGSRRWKIYRHAVENEFGPETFKHASDKANSSYILLRRRDDVTSEDLLFNILDTLHEFYDKSSGGQP